MSENNSIDLGNDWAPPPRPEWVARTNEEGRLMDIRALVPLDEDSLLRTARANTGLVDFGANDWYEPFQVFVKSLDTEADLHLVGRLRARSEILQLLEARLQIEETYKRHPEIDDEQIEAPIVIVGQPRSGTSHLINLLAANPDNGVIRTWEAMFPCPPPETSTYRTDPRIEKSHQLIDQWNRVTPTLRTMHEFGGNMPQECIHIMAINFMSSGWLGLFGQVPSYLEYVAKIDWTLAYRYHKRVLKLLQWKNPRQRWVLKTPLHLDLMPVMLQVYPDACVVWPHRDPVKAFASVVNMINTFLWGRSDKLLKNGALDFLIDPAAAAQRLSIPIDWMEAGIVPKERLCNILYRDLIADPITTVENIYRYFSLHLSEVGRKGIAQYVAEHPRDSRPPHRFKATEGGEILRQRALFKRYQDYFSVPSEN